MSQLVGNISVDQQCDAFRALVYPSAEFIPCVDFRTRRCIRLLRMDKQLLLKAVLVVVCRRNQKIGISVGIGGDIPGSLGRHLQNDSGICSAWELPPYLTLIVTSTVCAFSPRIDANKSPVLALDTFVTSSFSRQTVVLISFLVICVIVARFIAANRESHPAARH